MAWVAQDLSGKELMFEHRPRKHAEIWCLGGAVILLPKGTIYKLIGKNITFADRAVKLKPSALDKGK